MYYLESIRWGPAPKNYEDCDLGAIAGDAFSQYQYVLGLNFSAG